MKAQVSVEFLFIMGFALMLSLPLMYVFFKQTETMSADISGSQIDKVASEIRDAADEVYYLGPPSKKPLLVYLPQEVKGVTFSGNSIIFRVESPNGDYDIVKWTAVNFSVDSSITASSGLKRIFAQANTYDVFVNDTS
jgi:hypothetical protein